VERIAHVGVGLDVVKLLCVATLAVTVAVTTAVVTLIAAATSTTARTA
jgi:hypothetical protein